MKITIDELCKRLEQKLRNRPCIIRLYIGKTTDIEKREKQHEREGYHTTTPLAIASYSLASRAEEFLIKYFKESEMSAICSNINQNSTGRKPDETKLYYIYVSIAIKAKKEEELYDDNLDWNTIYDLTDN